MKWLSDGICINSIVVFGFFFHISGKVKYKKFGKSLNIFPQVSIVGRCECITYYYLIFPLLVEEGIGEPGEWWIAYIVIGVVVGAGLVLLAIVGALIVCIKKRRNAASK